MNVGEIAALLNGIMRLGIAWQEYGALMDRARAEGRQVNAEDVADLGRRARVAIDGLHAAIEAADPEPVDPEPLPDPPDEETSDGDPT
jgi:hypothetical protein